MYGIGLFFHLFVIPALNKFGNDAGGLYCFSIVSSNKDDSPVWKHEEKKMLLVFTLIVFLICYCCSSGLR